MRPHGTVAIRPIFWHHPAVVKTLALEDIYADPHKLDSYLVSGEPVAVMRDGRTVAEFVPHRDALKTNETRVLEGIARGERAVDQDRFVTHAEAKKRMARWLR